MDVPDEVIADIYSNVHIIDQSAADDLNETMGNSILTKLPNKYNDIREDKEHKMDAFVMDETAFDESLHNRSLGIPCAHSTFIGAENDYEESEYEESEPEESEYESDETDDNQILNRGLAPRFTSSTNESKVVFTEFSDPTTPNAKIRIEKSVVTQSTNQGRGAPDTCTTVHMKVQKSDPYGIVAQKQFSYKQGTQEPQQHIVPRPKIHDSQPNRSNAGNAIERYNPQTFDSNPEAPDTVRQPAFGDRFGSVASMFNSPKIVEWFVSHIPKGKLLIKR